MTCSTSWATATHKLLYLFERWWLWRTRNSTNNIGSRNLDIFSFSDFFLEVVVWENLSGSEVPEITQPAHLAPTTMQQSKSLNLPFFPLLMLGLNLSRFSQLCLIAYLYMLECTELLLCLSDICINNRWTDAPVSVYNDWWNHCWQKLLYCLLAPLSMMDDLQPN